MNKTELIERAARRAMCRPGEARGVLEALLEEMAQALNRGQEVQLTGFGTFKTAVLAARKGVNPRTRQSIDIPERRAVKFKASTALLK